MRGFDTSTICDAAAANELWSRGYCFAGRYYGLDSTKRLTSAEAAILAANNLAIVSLYEDDGKPASYYTTARGTADATRAVAQAGAAGQPGGTPIYFCVDYEATADDIANGITDYFTAVASVLNGQYDVGVYGSTAVCAALFAKRLATYAWITMSTDWNAGTTFDQWSIQQQSGQTVEVGGTPIEIDTDVANGECGLWSP